jgi:hypothetical protein
VKLTLFIVIVGLLSSAGVNLLMDHVIGVSLRDRHPREWSRLSKALFLRGAIQGFAFSDRHRELQDRDLTFQVMVYRAAVAGLLLSIVSAVVAPAFPR